MLSSNIRVPSMSVTLKSALSEIGRCLYRSRFNALKIAIFTIALSITPPAARSGTIACETSEVFYESKPSLQTECKELYPAETRLTSGINSRSLPYARSIHIFPKLANILGLLIRDNASSGNTFYPGFADQKISEEGAILESFYNKMLDSQIVITPIRTRPADTPFESF